VSGAGSIRTLLTFLLLMPLMAQDLMRLPEWARPHALAAQSELAPSNPDAWVLFDRTEVAYAGEGEIRTRRLRLVKVLSERGITEGTFAIFGLGGKSSQVKKLKGWNLRPDGELTKLDQDKVVTVDNASDADVSASTLTAAVLPRVVKGSLVAFESLQIIHHPMGPIDSARVLESHPIRRWELEPAKQEGWFTNLKKVEILVDRRHFSPWLPETSSLGERGIGVDRVPPLPKDELGHPSAHNVLPHVYVRFLDPDLRGVPPWKDWNGFATWFYFQYVDRIQTPSMETLKGMELKSGLGSLARWMAKELHYRAVYLTPERGWIPLPSDEIARRKYGDCKDLCCFMLTNLQQLGARGYPTLARVAEGDIENDEPPFLHFNHVIVAIRLEHSCDFAAEVATPMGRFLLIDPTDRFTPPGFLGGTHRNGKVLICTPEGGIWVQIPASAIQPSKVLVTLQGEVDGKGVLMATVKLTEWGNAWRLRSVAQAQGLKELRTHLLTSVLDVPPTAVLDLGKIGDPMDLGSPFSVEFLVKHPEGFRRSGNEGHLAPLGWRIIPAQIQKPGIQRQYPVSRGMSPELDYSAEVTVPYRCTPILASKTGETPFSTYSWVAAVSPAAGGTKLVLHLRHESKSVFYDFIHREDGVLAAKRDRIEIRNLIADALAFKVLP